MRELTCRLYYKQGNAHCRAVNINFVSVFRRALRRGESVKYLIPDPVIEYIKANKLYVPAEK